MKELLNFFNKRNLIVISILLLLCYQCIFYFLDIKEFNFILRLSLFILFILVYTYFYFFIMNKNSTLEIPRRISISTYLFTVSTYLYIVCSLFFYLLENIAKYNNWFLALFYVFLIPMQFLMISYGLIKIFTINNKEETNLSLLKISILAMLYSQCILAAFLGPPPSNGLISTGLFCLFPIIATYFYIFLINKNIFKITYNLFNIFYSYIILLIILFFIKDFLNNTFLENGTIEYLKYNLLLYTNILTYIFLAIFIYYIFKMKKQIIFYIPTLFAILSHIILNLYVLDTNHLNIIDNIIFTMTSINVKYFINKLYIIPISFILMQFILEVYVYYKNRKINIVSNKINTNNNTIRVIPNHLIAWTYLYIVCYFLFFFSIILTYTEPYGIVIVVYFFIPFSILYIRQFLIIKSIYVYYTNILKQNKQNLIVIV